MPKELFNQPLKTLLGLLDRISTGVPSQTGGDNIIYPDLREQIGDEIISNAPEETTIEDADELGFGDSSDSNLLKAITWVNLKAVIKTYLDTLYVALTGNQTVGGEKNFTDGIDIAASGTVLASISTGTGDNDKLPTQGYVDDNVGIPDVVSDLTPQAGGDFDFNRKRAIFSQGDDIASANDLVLDSTNNGNTYRITGSGQINRINIANWGTNSSPRIALYFVGAPLVKHGQASSGDNKIINLAGDVDFQAATGKVLVLALISDQWEEISRNELGGGGGGLSLEENDTPIADEDTLNIVSNNSEVILTNEAGVKNNYTPTIKSMNDYDATGEAAGSLIQRNATDDGYDVVSTSTFDSITNANEANLTADVQLSIILEAGYVIENIIIENTTANAVTGGIDIGSTASGNDIVSAEAVGANAVVNATITKEFFSISTDTDLYISAVTSWNSANLTVYITFKKVI